MTIKQFVEAISSFSPSIEKILESTRKVNPEFDRNDALEYDSMLRLKMVNPENENMSVIENLVYNTNASTAQIAQFQFESEIFVLDNLYECFASYNDFYRICKPLTLDEIGVCLFSGENYEILAPNEEIFLLFLIEFDRYWKHLFFDIEYSSEQNKEQIAHIINMGFNESWISTFMPEFQ